jgi:uncharacterized protein
MRTSKNCLPDVNVWLALALDWHIHFDRAVAWFRTTPLESAAFCRITQMGLLRLLTNPKMMGEDVLTQRQAWAHYEHLRRDGRIVYIDEPQFIEPEWKSRSSRPAPSQGKWTDDYLAAVASLTGLTLVTFDSGFSKYPSLDVDIL